LRQILLVIAAALAAFAAVVPSSFHFDDYAMFSDPAVTSPFGWIEVWRFAQTRPLTYFTFWLNYQLGGTSPVGYHVLNLALHVGASVLLLLALGGLEARRRAQPFPTTALVAALLFAVHPIQTEPVAYVFARSSILCTLFCLLALWLWARDREWLSVAAFSAGVLAKEECAAFPVVLLALWWFGGRVELRRKLAAIGGMFVVAVAAVVRVAFMAGVIRGSGAGAGAKIGAVEYASVQGFAILRYLAMLVVPWGFTVDPAIDPPAWLRAAAWIALLALICFAARRASPDRPGFWLMAGLILLVPTSTIFPADDLAADRRMYLPMIAFSFAAALAVCNWKRPLIAGLVAALAAISVHYSLVWRSERSLWSEAVRQAPGKLRPRLQLARAVPAHEALDILAGAERIAPGDASVASEEGRAYLELGRPAEALPAFGRALAASPSDPSAMNNRGVALMFLGQPGAARQDFERALQINPCLFDAWLNLKRLGERPPEASCRFTPAQEAQLKDR
jgi:hypothetical protein